MQKETPTPPESAAQTGSHKAAADAPGSSDGGEGGTLHVSRWVIALIITNLLAVLGPASTFIAWKATIETQQRYDREQSARELSQIRSAVADGLAAVERRLDRGESLQTEVAALRAQTAGDRERLADALSRIHSLEDRLSYRSSRYRDDR